MRTDLVAGGPRPHRIGLRIHSDDVEMTCSIQAQLILCDDTIYFSFRTVQTSSHRSAKGRNVPTQNRTSGLRFRSVFFVEHSWKLFQAVSLFHGLWSWLAEIFPRLPISRHQAGSSWFMFYKTCRYFALATVKMERCLLFHAMDAMAIQRCCREQQSFNVELINQEREPTIKHSPDNLCSFIEEWHVGRDQQIKFGNGAKPWSSRKRGPEVNSRGMSFISAFAK